MSKFKAFALCCLCFTVFLPVAMLGNGLLVLAREGQDVSWDVSWTLMLVLLVLLMSAIIIFESLAQRMEKRQTGHQDTGLQLHCGGCFFRLLRCYWHSRRGAGQEREHFSILYGVVQIKHAILLKAEKVFTIAFFVLLFSQLALTHPDVWTISGIAGIEEAQQMLWWHIGSLFFKFFIWDAVMAWMLYFLLKKEEVWWRLHMADAALGAVHGR